MFRHCSESPRFYCLESPICASPSEGEDPFFNAQGHGKNFYEGNFSSDILTSFSTGEDPKVQYLRCMIKGWWWKINTVTRSFEIQFFLMTLVWVCFSKWAKFHGRSYGFHNQFRWLGKTTGDVKPPFLLRHSGRKVFFCSSWHCFRQNALGIVSFQVLSEDCKHLSVCRWLRKKKKEKKASTVWELTWRSFRLSHSTKLGNVDILLAYESTPYLSWRGSQVE